MCLLGNAIENEVKLMKKMNFKKLAYDIMIDVVGGILIGLGIL